MRNVVTIRGIERAIAVAATVVITVFLGRSADAREYELIEGSEWNSTTESLPLTGTFSLANAGICVVRPDDTLDCLIRLLLVTELDLRAGATELGFGPRIPPSFPFAGSVGFGDLITQWDDEVKLPHVVLESSVLARGFLAQGDPPWPAFEDLRILELSTGHGESFRPGELEYGDPWSSLPTTVDLEFGVFESVFRNRLQLVDGEYEPIWGSGGYQSSELVARISLRANVIPEPETAWLQAIGVVGLVALLRRRTRHTDPGDGRYSGVTYADVMPPSTRKVEPVT